MLLTSTTSIEDLLMKTSMLPKILSLFLLTVVSLYILTCNSSFAFEVGVDDYETQLDAVDKSHQTFTYQFYQALTNSPEFKGENFNTLEALTKASNAAIEKEDSVKAIALIIKNKKLLSRYYDSPYTITLINVLLDHNVYVHAGKIMQTIRQQNDDIINEQLNYLTTHFQFTRKAWPAVLANFEDDIKTLPTAQYDHALLMKGIALQKLGKHDLSTNIYQKISLSSSHYSTAQFNIALANIRQGWWSDGHRLLKNIIKRQNTDVDSITTVDNMLDRLHITLGFSLLNQSYYRNARKSFQHVGLHSRYSNQALLGIALTAAHQDDYIGALHATRYLKNVEQDDLPVDEAYLLMPFFYEKTQQLDTASAGYSEAEFYYQKKISQLTMLINTPILLPELIEQPEHSFQMNIKDMNIDFSENYPDYYFKQRQSFLDCASRVTTLNNDKVSAEFKEVKSQYQNLTTKMAKSIMKKRVSELQSYLNQSRYGLARLYDNNTVEK